MLPDNCNESRAIAAQAGSEASTGLIKKDSTKVTPIVRPRSMSEGVEVLVEGGRGKRRMGAVGGKRGNTSRTLQAVLDIDGLLQQVLLVAIA